MKKVYILHHSYELGGRDDTKLIGVYETKELAELAIRRLIDKRGFQDRPNDFEISEYELNSDAWKEGYLTHTTIKVKNKAGEMVDVEAECLINGFYKIFGVEGDSSFEQFQDQDIVECKTINDELVAVKVIEKFKK